MNIASILGLRVAGAVAPYAISKAGVVQVTKALSREMSMVCWTHSESIERIFSAILWVAQLRRNSSVNFRSGSRALYSAPPCVAVVVRFMQGHRFSASCAISMG